MAILLAISAVALASPCAYADKHSSVVMVSVHVVESCRVETDGSVTSNSVDLKMRCSSSVRPSLGLAGSSRTLPAVGTVSLAHSEITASANGPTLNIQF